MRVTQSCRRSQVGRPLVSDLIPVGVRGFCSRVGENEAGEVGLVGVQQPERPGQRR